MPSSRGFFSLFLLRTAIMKGGRREIKGLSFVFLPLPPIPPFSPFHSAEKKHFRQRRRDPIFERQRGFHPSFVACCSLQVLVYELRLRAKRGSRKKLPWCHFTIRMALFRVRGGTPNMNQTKVCYEKYSRRCASEWSELLFPVSCAHPSTFLAAAIADSSRDGKCCSSCSCCSCCGDHFGSGLL